MNKSPVIAALPLSHSTANTQQHSANEYIFNQANLAHYEAAAIHSLSYVHKAVSRTNKVFNGTLAHQLRHEFEHIDLNKPLPSFDNALAEVDKLYLQNAVYFHHPKYVAHLNCPVAYPAVVAEQILTAVNSSLDTYDQSGGATLIEQKIIDWTASIIGFNNNADGIFTSGGSQSNLMAMLIARDYFAKTQQHCDIKRHGLPKNSHKFRIFTSELSHFSIQKSAAILGLGYESVVAVKADSKFKMCPRALANAIEAAKADDLIPIAVVATAGTTDFGSIDPLPEIHALCQQYNLWFHVDAAYGCGLLVSNQNRNMIAGVELAHSVTIDYHKAFLQPVSSSAFMLQDGSLFSLLTHHADYLNPLCCDTNKTPNLVDKSIQTTRRFDALKLWLTLRTMGACGIGQVFDKVISLAKQCHALVAQDEEFELIHQPELTTLVFRFVDNSLSLAALNELNNQLKETLFTNGNCAIARTKIAGVQYLKFTLLNPATELIHIAEILSEIKTQAYLLCAKSREKEVQHG